MTTEYITMAIAAALIGGLVFLVLGAEWMVRGAARLAVLAGVSRLVVGLTIVAFGTSSPELVISLSAALRSQTDLAVGNVVGSNIFNILVILGTCAIIAPIVVDRKLLKTDVLVMIGVSILVLLMSLDGNLGRINGVILSLGILLYTVWTILEGKKAIAEGQADDDEVDNVPPRLPRDMSLIFFGLIFLAGGSHIFVSGAVDLARLLGVSELVIGLTIVAAGTSLPEAATSIVAAFRGQREIAVGNVVGSNIFNLLGVLGPTAMIATIPVSSQLLGADLLFMVAVAMACFPIFLSNFRVERLEGAAFVLFFAGYMGYVVLRAQEHTLYGPFRDILIWFVLPLTAVILFSILSKEGWKYLRR